MIPHDALHSSGGGEPAPSSPTPPSFQEGVGDAGDVSASMALVHVPRAEFSGRRERRQARRARRRRVAFLTMAPLGALGLGLLFVPVPQSEPPLAAALDDPSSVPPPPPSVAAVLPRPEPAETSTTLPTWVLIPVALPGWSGDGRLWTDGARAPRVLPGQRGRSIVVVPVDPSGAATFNAAGRTWRVMADPVSLPAGVAIGDLVGPSPLVPTVMLVREEPPHQLVEAR